jgi:hypothetical protein
MRPLGVELLLGFAIVDRQPTASATAVWLTGHEGSRVGHTNAVVIPHDDEWHDNKVRALTADRAVVLTTGTEPPLPFQHALDIEVFDRFLEETAAYQQRIEEAVADYAARTKSKNLVTPEFATARPLLEVGAGDRPELRALAVANYVAAVWSAWLATDEQRVRRAINPRTGKTPWIMPEPLGSPELAEFSPEFGKLVWPEPLTPCSTL